MTHTPDGGGHEDPDGRDSRDAGRKLDEDAAWRSIIENYGERAVVEPDSPVAEPSTPVAEPDSPVAEPGPPVVEPRPPVVEPVETRDQLNTNASWDDEGHFVPPDPPPPPPIEPRRRIAWSGLFGAPMLLLLGVVLGWRYPDWANAGLVAAFVGGFVYLVATMPRGPGGDGSHDNGAVV